jgi:sulfur carrier protein ThiS
LRSGFGIYKSTLALPPVFCRDTASDRQQPFNRACYIDENAVNITIKAYHELKPLAERITDGGQLVLSDGETVDGALQQLGIPPQKRTRLVLFVNGRMARRSTQLNEGDTLVFFSSIAGG